MMVNDLSDHTAAYTEFKMTLKIGWRWLKVGELGELSSSWGCIAGGPGIKEEKKNPPSSLTTVFIPFPP